jgi:signal transduction histidine kinase
LQDEKMMSLGRLAAGLAHELNNPVSVMARGAKQLRAALADAERASRGLFRAGLSEHQVDAIESASSTWPEHPASTASFDGEREIARWLAARHVDSDVSDLSDSGVTVGQLDELADLVPEASLGAALEWLVADRAARSTASDIEKAAKRISDLVEAMKRFTNLDRISGSEPVDVASGLRDTVRIMAPRGVPKDATLTLEIGTDVPTVHAVASELNQAWTNLIENAFDAVGHSGHVKVTLGKELDQVVVRVIDDGPGIKPEIISRIFDPFFTTKPPGQGVGLGLEIARQMLRRYRGEISVRSEPGRTEFTARLPAHSPIEAERAGS